MGKQKPKPKYNFTLEDTLGGLDISQDPIIQKAKAAQIARASQNTLSQTSITDPTIQFLQYDKDVYDEYLNPGQHDGSPEDLDYQVGENQSTIKQMINGAGRLLPLVVTKLTGQVNAVKQAADYALGNKEAFYDDEFANGVKQWEDSIKASMPIYATRTYDDGSLLEQMGTAKFWADDMGDGIAFLGAQIIGTKGLGAGLNQLGKGAAWLGAGIDAASIASKVPAAAKVANAIANNYTAVTAGLVNAGFSGALQAQDTSGQIQEGLKGKVNPNTGSEYTEAEIKTIAGEKAANTFNATFLAHVLPGIWESKIFLGLNRARLGDVREQIMGAVNRGELKLTDLLRGVGEGALAKNTLKEIGKGVIKGAAIEGLWEENIEQSIQNYDVQTGLNNENVGVADRTMNYAMGLLNNFNTKEDAKAIVMGALLGGPMGAVGSYSKAKSFNQQLPGYLDSLRSSDALYQQDINSIYQTREKDEVDSEGTVVHAKGSLILDDQGNPIEDTDKLKNLTFQVINNKKLWDKQTVATLTGNTDMATLNENIALSAAVYRELAYAMEDGDTEGALDFLKWRVKKQLQEQEDARTRPEQTEEATDMAAMAASDGSPQENIEAEQAATQARSQSAQFNSKERAELSQAVNSNMSKLDKFADNFRVSDNQAKRLLKIGQDPDRVTFNRIVQKGLFYEATKRDSLDEMLEVRKNELNDPLADVERITNEINQLTQLKADSIEKSKKYLNDTDAVFNEWKGPQSAYTSLVQDAVKPVEDTDPDKKIASERKRNTALYRLNEMEAVEGLNTDKGAPIFRQEIISQPIATRGDKPVGTRDQFFWKAGNDMAQLNELNNKITDYQSGKTSIKDVLTYAKESISHLDADTAKRLNELLTAEREKLASIEDQLSQTEETLYSEPDEEGEIDYLGTNPEFTKLLEERDNVQGDINDAQWILANKEAAAELDLINQEPQNVERHLVREFAERHFNKGRYVLQNALDSNGDVKEDYFDRTTVNNAIKDLTLMRDALEDRLNGGDLDGVKGLNYLVTNANKILTQLYKVREQAELNQSNREGKQSAINRAEAEILLNGIGYGNEAILNQSLYNAVDAVLNGTLSKTLKDIEGLSSNHYEATMALLHKVQSTATTGQLGKINQELQSMRNSAQVVAKDLLGTKGNNSFIVKHFGENPRQVFVSAWINLSLKYSEQGFPRLLNTKGSPMNQFNKNNDVQELMAKVDSMENGDQIGMPKDEFLRLLTAYNQALSAEKVSNYLSTPIRPIVKSELESAAQEELAPTTQQDISIREGISWLSRDTKAVSPFKGWAFLRGIAGTGKTNVVLKWILNNSGINKDDVVSIALTETATQVVGQSTGTKSLTFNQLMEGGLPTNIKLLIIDEYGTIGERGITELEGRIRELRKAGQDIKVLMLGDPTQITPRLQDNDDINNVAVNRNAGNIEIINPVTVVYRSDISAVNEASDIFQDNNQPVNSITVRADRALGVPLAKGVHVSSAASQIAETIARNIEAETQNKEKPRTRAIIVARAADMAKYEGLGAEVMTVYDAQSKTYDEVYVDMANNAFASTETFNTAMYTAASRAKQYAFLTYPNGENITDTSLVPEFNNNIDKLKESKTAFIQAKTAELAMMDGLDKGQTIKQTAKDSREDVQNAGKSALDIEVEESASEQDPEVVAEVPSTSDESDSQVDNDPTGIDIDPETGNEAAPAEVNPVVVGTRQAVDNVDAEAYPALRDGQIGMGSPVLYIYNKESNGENAVSILSQTRDGRWVKIGKIFQEQINNDPRFSDIRNKVGSMKPFYSDETDVLNGRRTGGTPYSAAQLAQYGVREGKIGASQYLRFLYHGGLTGGPNLAKSIGQIFKDKFYYKSQSEKGDKVHFKIFTETDLTKGYDGTFRPEPGIPYAVVGSDGVSYKNAMFVRLQPNRITQQDDQVVTLKRLAGSIEKIQNLTGILMGTKGFSDLIRVFRNSLEIIQEQDTDGQGTVARVKARTDFTRQEMIAHAEDLFEKENRTGDPDMLKMVPDEKLQDVINAVQDAAMQLYGIKNKEGKYTEAEIAAMGEEWESVPMNTQEKRGGDPLFYAQLKGATKRQYKRQYRLEIDNGVAQIAFDQIARANEFVGGTRIRVQRHTGKADRKASYKGKSLINAEGGSSKVYELLSLMARTVTLPKMVAAGQVDDDSLGFKAALAKVREDVDAAGQDPTLYLSNELQSLGDDAVNTQVASILRKKETPPVNLATLQMIVDPANYDQSGGHATQDRFRVTDARGNTETKSTFLRKPLMLDKFNELGSDPVANAAELGRMVTTSFDGISPTRIDVDFGEVVVQSTDEISAELPSSPEEITTEFHSDIDTRIAEINSQLATEKSALAKRKLLKEKTELENSRGRMPYDLSSDRPSPGKRVNVNQAIADLKRMLPDTTEDQVFFVERSVLTQMAQPGENLLGLFDKSNIYLDTNEEGVYDRVLRHEVMHKIYNEYLTPREKLALRNELDPQSRLNGRDFDELVADSFMSWQRVQDAGWITPGIRRIFQKIMDWFGFFRTNKSAMETIFQNVEDGKYTKKIGGTSDVRRGFSDIRKDFGSVANYRFAVNTVHGMVKDSVMVDDLNVSPITMKEAKEFVRQQLLNKKNNLEAIYKENQDLIVELINGNDEEVAEAQSVIDENTDIQAQIATLSSMFPTTGSGAVSDKVYNQLWKDMYPNYNFREGERISSFEEYPEEYTEEDALNDQQLAEDQGSSSLQDFTVQSDERNLEGKVTENVKNFLSFIFRAPKKVVNKITGKEEWITERVNPRYAYLECLRNLNGLISSNGNLKEQLREAAASNGIDLNGNSDGRRVIDYLLNLIDNATSTDFVDSKGTHVELPRTARFYGENKFSLAGDSIAGVSEADADITHTRQQGESTPAFIRRISDDTGFSKAEVVGYFKQAQAQETMREVMSNFLSQRESDPLIAEEAREGQLGNSKRVLRYFRAQMYGAERIMATDIENAIKSNWLKIPTTVWNNFDAEKNDNNKVSIILKALGINKDSKELNLSLTADIIANLKAFRNVVNQSYKDGKPSVITKKGTEEEGLESEQESVQVADVEYLLASEPSLINNLTKTLSRNSADARPAKYQSTDGRSRYSFHNSNQAIETIQRVIDNTGKNIRKATGLPAHLNDAWGKMNIFVSGKINQIIKIVDHDGMRKEWGEEFAIGYTDESNAQNLARQFSYGFLNFAMKNTTSSDPNLKYVQFFYTISNRPRMLGAEMNILKPSQLREAAHAMLNQHLAQPDHKSIANYSKYKTINMELLGEAIGPKNAEAYAKLQKDPAAREAIIDKFMENLKGLSKQVADRMVQEKVVIGDDAGALATMMKDSKRRYIEPAVETLPGRITQTKDNLGYTAESILPLVEQWVANNYINGYFLNQLPVGNFNYFKSAIDLVKRMSGVFAPGTKGLVDATGEFFMKPKFRMAIMEDPKMFSNELSEVFRDNDTALYNEAKNNVSKQVDGSKKEKGFDLADAQGFMLPSRAANIIAGMGNAYNAGAIFKPAHYEVADRGAAGFTPVMIKYSSAVLSDELVQKFPKLLKLREAMERNQVDELVFDSANKVGGPTTARTVPILNDFGSGSFDISEDAVIDLSNENYRLQLNPKHDTFSDVANPTQLGYFLNVMGRINPEAGAVNDPAATEVYTAIANLIKHGLNKLNAGLTRTGKIDKRQIQKTLTGAGNERIAEMLKELDYNMPNIADKALIQIMNLFSKDTVKIKFKGGKFVLQSAYGFEMIKPGSERYNAMSDPQRKAHDENWSRYGEEERSKIVGQARSLKYGTDEKGRMFAEVLIDKNYADKARIGDFLLPDMMGYRIPSTELHSSVAVKVAGFYDSKGSNVIVAPPELVMQHGSDFDVDSLYVIGRESYDSAIPELDYEGGPVGYEWNPRVNKFVFNKKNWDDRLPKWYAKAGSNKALIAKIDKIYQMYQRNIVIENFLNVISHPVNIGRMTEPISTQVITDALDALNLNKENLVDLSNPLDNLEVYNSNFQGAKLVGVFANGMKALAYMLKAGPNGSYPVMQNEEAGITLGNTTYNEFSEKVDTGNIWQVLDALVNTSVDNVKDQKLYKINATNATGNMYVASQALGIPLKDVITFMLQPIALQHSAVGGKLETVKADLLAAYNSKATVKVENYPDLAALSSSTSAPSVQTMRGFMNKQLSELDEKDLLKQASMMRSFENLYNLGQDVSTFSSAVGVVQTLPVMYEDIQKRQDQWNKLGAPDADGNFKTNEDFSFNIDNLFEAQPNIREAYGVFQAAKKTAELSLTKHLPAVRAFVADVVKESGVRLSFKQNVEDVKNELISYLISSMYSNENRVEAPYNYTYKGATKIATGKQAWSQRFIDSVEAYKKNIKGTDAANAFLSKIGIQNRYGLKTLTFAISSNSDYMDNIEMQEAFEQLPSDEMKADFVKYAIMNYGLKFGVKNYSMFIPVEYLKPVDQYMRKIDRALRNNKIGDDGSVSEGELKNIKDNFMLRMAVNNVDKLPFISSRKMKAIPTPGKTIVINEPTGPRSIPALNGLDEYYYNRKYANPIVGENDKRQFRRDEFPQFIKTSENVALMRLNDPNNDFIYYQRLGMKNWLGGYDASIDALNGDYNIAKYFGKGIIPVPVGDVQAGSFQVNNEYIQEGSKVIVYGYSNESRDQGRIGIVTSVQSDLTSKEKKIIKIQDIKDGTESKAHELFRERYTPLVNMLSSKFNIPIRMVTDDQMADLMGEYSIKGALVDGVAYISMDTATGDTAFHEIGHALIKTIAKKNPAWYKNLVKEVNNSDRGKELKSLVEKVYRRDIEEEVIVTLLGELAEENYIESTSLTTALKRLMREIGSMVKSVLASMGVINVDMLSNPEAAVLTMEDLAQIMAAKDVNISLDLSGYERNERQSRKLNELEQKLFNEGRITLTCKV